MFETILRVFRRACSINNDCLVAARQTHTTTVLSLGYLVARSFLAFFVRILDIRHDPDFLSYTSHPRHEKCEEQAIRQSLMWISSTALTETDVDSSLAEPVPKTPLCASLKSVHGVREPTPCDQKIQYGQGGAISSPGSHRYLNLSSSEDELFSGHSSGDTPQPLPPRLETGAYDIYRPYERATHLGFRLIAHHRDTAVHQVHIAYDTGIRRVHAVKSTRKSNQSRDVIEAEKAAYRMLIRAQYCPYVVALFRVLESEDLYHFIMDYYPYSLADILSAGSIDVEEARLFAGQVLLGMQHVHAQDIVHADMKPQNILISRDGSAVISDFGLALMPEVASGRGPWAIGTYGTRGYMAPEMFSSQCWSFSVDIWAYGCLLYDMLSRTGVPYFLIDTSSDEDIRERTLTHHLRRRTILTHVSNRFCTDLIIRLWSRNTSRRPCLAGIKSHIFFHGLSWDGAHSSF